MANKVYNMDGGLHSSAALGGLEDAMYGSSVANSNSFKVTAGTGMNVSIATGDGLISTGTGFARRIATDAVNTVAISAASTANPRIDSIVAYIDNAITPVQTVLNNTNGILKFAAVAGSPASSPVAPSAGAIQTAVGAGNPYMVLCNVRVPANATSLTTATFIDMRNIANEISTGDVVDGAITSEKIADGAITGAKINWNNIPYYRGIWTGSNPLGAGWTTELTVNITTPGTYALFGNVRTANRKGSSTGYSSRIAVSGTNVMSAQGRWWGAAGEVHDMPCYTVATYTSAGTATVQAITDDTYQTNCVELATLIAIRIA